MLTTDQVGFFEREGYLVVPDVLDTDDLAPIWTEYDEALDAAARDLHHRGLLDELHEGLPFDERYSAIVAECPDVYRYLGISLPLSNGPADADSCRAHTGPALFGLLRHPKVLDVVESIIGPEIMCNPVQQARIKPPLRTLTGSVAGYSNVGSTTWHQDFGAVMDEALETDLLTVWIAITDATLDMGCLVVIPRSHEPEELTLHCPGVKVEGENYIPSALLDGRPMVPLPAAAGSIVLLSKWTEHGALDNVSDRLRWSFDLRYQPTGQPTGRPAFPGWVARSRANPESELRDPKVYAQLWEDARRRIVDGALDGPVFEQARWAANAGNPICA